MPVSSSDPMWGERDAPVTIVLFADFACPFSANVQAALEQVKTAYGPRTVRIIWKNSPLRNHPRAKPTAEAAAGVFELGGNDAFWRFYDALWRGQQVQTDENLEAWATTAGVTDMAAWKAGVAAHRWGAKVEDDLAVGAGAGVRATPTFFINGQVVTGAQPFEKFRERIDGELARARKLIADGTPPGRVYSELTTKSAKPLSGVTAKADPPALYQVQTGTSPSRGSADALVTLVLFSEFQCADCNKLEPTIATLRKKYGDELRVVWKNNPRAGHYHSEPAAELALEARAEKGDLGFWTAHDKLFEREGNLSPYGFERIARALHLDVARVKAAISDHKFTKEIDSDRAEFIALASHDMPSLFINGRHFAGAVPEATLVEAIDSARAKAEEVLAAGTPRGQLYDTLIRGGKGPEEGQPQKTVALENVPPKDPTRGNPRARVVIHEFADFQCAFSERVETTLHEIERTYGDKVLLVWHDLPLPVHANASMAAEAAREVLAQKGVAAFWKMHDKLFANQPRLAREDLDGYAALLGLDMDKWDAALENKTWRAAVDADIKVATSAGLHGTPTFVVNGYVVAGAQPFDVFRKAIERALSETR